MDPQRPDVDDAIISTKKITDDELPQCKIKRNYSCNHCTYFTQNPRFYLTHLRDLHGERIVINKCNLCLYASRHYQKLVRHMKMVHGSTEGIAGQSRKRPAVEDSAWNQLQKKAPPPPPPALIFPIEMSTNFENLPNDLELSRKSLKDIAALYFAENQIDNIMTQMEKADAVQLPVPTRELRVTVKRKSTIGTFFDQLKKSVVDEDNLACSCGHVSKCFSESVIHRKSCKEEDKPKDEAPKVNLTSGSTRCQLCRRRCKSSVDLLKHRKLCSQTEPSTSSLTDGNSDSINATENGKVLESDVATSRASDAIGFQQRKCEASNVDAIGDSIDFKNCSDLKVTATAISNKKTSEEESASSPVKKVFKCPCCSFWASTASRFHVHIVGHLNRKPFKCSLCAYRSNWRWDITKHIRLKAIRNPYHKSARVIMSDEAGRRNYTKYNKYITLMKLNDEDGDPRQIRSGEMTPNQEVSLDLVNEFSKTGTELLTDNTDPLLKQIEAGNKCIAPPLNRLSEHLRRDVKTDGLEKKTSYNCRKCQFRHTNRDAVLAHVKIHHQSAECLPSSSNAQDEGIESSVKPNMNKDFAAALCLSPKHLLEEKSTRSDNHSILSQCDGASSIISTFSSLSKHDEPSKEVSDDLNCEMTDTANLPAAITPSIVTSPANSITDRSSSIIRGGSKSGMSIAVKANTNFLADRRGPSPFRCGHCHQVSNWKHVIQRHCRLKHCGQIQIESLHRTTDGCTPLYRRLDFYGTGSVRHVVSSSTTDCKIGPIKVSQQKDEIVSTKNKELSKSKEPISPSNSDEQTPNPTTKQFKCPSCPYVSDDKLQLNFHISLHKHKQYKCTLCSCVCTKRQHLSSHIKSHENDLKEPIKSLDEGKPPAVLPTKVISHCPKCPEMFVNSSKKLQQHLKAHGAIFEHQCDVCDFSAKQKAILLSHSFAHTSIYQEKAELIIKDAKDDPEYPTQKVRQITLPGVATPTWVVGDIKKKSQLEAEPVEDSVTSTSSPSALKNCPYCSFQSACNKSFQHHIQHHIRVTKDPEGDPCLDCDFKKSSKINLNEPTQIHVEVEDQKTSVSTDNDGKKNENQNKKVETKSDSKVKERKEKTEKIPTTNKQSKKSAPKDEKKPSQSPSNHKTILVNPKTGQVIKRN